MSMPFFDPLLIAPPSFLVVGNNISSRRQLTMLRAYKVENQRTEETATASKRRRRFVARPFILATLAAMAIYCNLSFFKRRLGALEQLPTMYTFYSKIADVPMPAGMSHEDHSRLLIFWQKAWRQAGWNAVVLNETDAMKHPDYQRLQPLVKKTGAGAYNVSLIPARKLVALTNLQH